MRRTCGVAGHGVRVLTVCSWCADVLVHTRCIRLLDQHSFPLSAQLQAVWSLKPHPHLKR